ncbi:hypothetical protein ABZS85_08210, partial [Streptomyces sp. NPDC005322]
MRALPVGARAYVLCAVLAGVLCAAPAVARSGAAVPWATLALLAAVYAAGAREARAPWPEWCGPVLLAGAFLLPPAAAALVPVPGALLARVERRPAGVGGGGGGPRRPRAPEVAPVPPPPAPPPAARWGGRA